MFCYCAQILCEALQCSEQCHDRHSSTTFRVVQVRAQEYSDACDSLPLRSERTKFLLPSQVADEDGQSAFNLHILITSVDESSSTSGIDKRVCKCMSGDFEFKLELLGDHAKESVNPGPFALVGARLNEYKGKWTLSSGHLTALIPIELSSVPARQDSSVPMLTELKPCSVQVCSVAQLLKITEDKQRARVVAKLRPFDQSVFQSNFSWGDLKFRLFGGFHDDTGSFRASVWTEDIVTLFGKTRDEINEMWEACDPDAPLAEEARTEFLRVLSTHAEASFNMTVTTRTWEPCSPPSKRARTEVSVSGQSVQFSIEDLCLVQS